MFVFVTNIQEERGGAKYGRTDVLLLRSVSHVDAGLVLRR